MFAGISSKKLTDPAVPPVLVAVNEYVTVSPERTLIPATGAVCTLTTVTTAGPLTVTVPVQRNAAGQAGSPVVALAVLVTLVVPVFVTAKVATVALTAPAATVVVVATQVTVLVVPLPTKGSALEGVQVKPVPLVIAVKVTPVGIVSTMVVGLVVATGPELLACTV